MNTIFHQAYYLILITAVIIGILKYKRLDAAMRVIVILLVTTCLCELLSYITAALKIIATRYAIYHVYNIIEMFLQGLFFIYAIKPYHYRKLIWTSAILWPAIGLFNIMYLQPINKLNTNMLLCESFCTITLSLYFIYWQLKNTEDINLFKQPHFRITILLLLLWSSTFFFWAFITVLYNDHWSYYLMMDHAQLTSNIIVYAGIALTLFFYPTKSRGIENN